MILVIDNYDSFVWNIVHYLRELGAEVRVVRNDEVDAAGALASGADAFLLSPGPGGPEGAGVSLGLVAACANHARPMLGICLGQQTIAAHFGSCVARAARPVHGKTSLIRHDGRGLFEGLPSPFTAARYHSLTVPGDTLPDCLEPCAWADDDSTLQALRHRHLPLHGVQFHPESIASEYGHLLLRNFLALI